MCFFNFGIFTFSFLKNFVYSNNLSIPTVFLIVAAIQIPIKKLIRDAPIAFVVTAKTPTPTPPFTIPHFKFLNSILFLLLLYL